LAGALIEREYVGRLGVDSTLEHIEICALHLVEPPTADDLEPTAGPLAEWVPGIGSSPLKRDTAPVG
jgi:hypothetical protein